jgi:hypothetical protein
MRESHDGGEVDKGIYQVTKWLDIHDEWGEVGLFSDQMSGWHVYEI